MCAVMAFRRCSGVAVFPNSLRRLSARRASSRACRRWSPMARCGCIVRTYSLVAASLGPSRRSHSAMNMYCSFIIRNAALRPETSYILPIRLLLVTFKHSSPELGFRQNNQFITREYQTICCGRCWRERSIWLCYHTETAPGRRSSARVSTIARPISCDGSRGLPRNAMAQGRQHHCVPSSAVLPPVGHSVDVSRH